MSPPAPIPPAPDEAGAPVSILVDYDGTISRIDVLDELIRRFARDPRWREKDEAYAAGRVGSRELIAWDLDTLPRDGELLRTTAAALPHDETFPAFVERAAAWGAAVEVVSDGLGFYVDPALRALGTPLEVATNRVDLDVDPPAVAFPYGHPTCHVCGTCKRERVRGHQRGGQVVVYVGDGTSDRYAAAYADVTFAKGELAELCRAEGWRHRRWERFADVTTWLDAAFADGRLPRARSDVARWRASNDRGTERGFICGPEVWGPDRTTPPIPPIPPAPSAGGHRGGEPV